MPEVWIRSNRRVLAMGLIPAAMLDLAGVIVLALSFLSGAHWGWMVLGGVLSLVGTIATLVLLMLMQQPRVGYENGNLLVYLESTVPAAVPIESVECFFQGQGPGFLRSATGGDAEVSTVIVRLAEAAHDWHHRDVQASLGHWCEGYITIRGTWCEPITPDLMKRLNKRLVEVHRERKQRLQEATA